MAASHTPNLNLNKPDRQDFVSVITDINYNMDKIDTAHGHLMGNYIPSTDDLNNYYGNEYTGLYNIGATAPANCPDTWVQLMVIATSSGVVQLILHENYIRLRRRTGSPIAWTAWRTVLIYDTDWIKIQKDGDNSYIQYRKTGNVVTIMASHKVSSATIPVWGSYVLGQIPSDIRPPFDLNVRASTDRSGSNGVVFAVGSNGNVYFRGMYTGASDTSDVLNGIVTYTINSP